MMRIRETGNRARSGGALVWGVRIGATAAIVVLGLFVEARGGPISEVEPNNSIDEANLLRTGEHGLGGMTDAARADFWRLPHVRQGDLVFAWVDTHPSPPINNVEPASVLFVFNDQSDVIAFNDDDGPRESSVVAGMASPAAGDLFLGVGAASNPDLLVSYNLHVAAIDPADTGVEIEPNNTVDDANFMTSAIMTGNTGLAQQDVYQIHVRQNERVDVILDADPERDGVVTPLFVRIASGDGLTIRANSDVNSVSTATENSGHAAGTVVASQDGKLLIVVRGFSDRFDSSYRFIVLVNDRVYVDADEDTLETVRDNCPLVANLDQADRDSDRTGDACDLCPDDLIKKEPGECGCDRPDVDVDADGDLDCEVDDPARAMMSTTGIVLGASSLSGGVSAYDPRTGNLVDPLFISEEASGSIVTGIGFDEANRRVVLLLPDRVRMRSVSLDTFEGASFGPSGGPTAVFDEPEDVEVLKDGHVLMTINNGPDQIGVVEFDSEGGFLGQLGVAGAGVLAGPMSMLVIGDELMVSDGTRDLIQRFRLEDGQLVGTQAQVESFPRGLASTSRGTILVAVEFGLQRGIVEFARDGDLVGHYSPAGVNFFRSVFEMANGNLLVAGGPGLVEIDREGRVVEAKDRRFLSNSLELVLFDADDDGIGDDLDNCPDDANPDQEDADGDGIGDACDASINGDEDPAPGSGPGGDEVVLPGAAEVPCGTCGNGAAPGAMLFAAAVFLMRGRSGARRECGRAMRRERR